MSGFPMLHKNLGPLEFLTAEHQRILYAFSGKIVIHSVETWNGYIELDAVL